MADLDTFAPGEGQGEAMSEEGFEKFKEQMRAAAAAMQQATKDEARQKKKEDRLLQILLQYFKDPKKKDILLLASRVLEQNTLPHFVLSVLVLGDEEFQKDVIGAEGDQTKQPPHIELEIPYDNEIVKRDIKHWAIGMIAQGRTNAERMKKTIYDDHGKIKLLVIQFAVFVMRDYLTRHHTVPSYNELKEFSENLLAKVMEKIIKAVPAES
ncbi:hypothetical protein HZA39_02155 [Candidatus Peregrinibacteria bacterium]|nr:hypothetical protein [Candidatus Peregrinibacteria bacterium]